MNHINESEKAKKFFEAAGITIEEDSAHNAVTLKRGNETLTMWAESYHSIAAGIPGIYVYDNE